MIHQRNERLEGDLSVLLKGHLARSACAHATATAWSFGHSFAQPVQRTLQHLRVAQTVVSSHSTAWNAAVHSIGRYPSNNLHHPVGEAVLLCTTRHVHHHPLFLHIRSNHIGIQYQLRELQL